MNGPATMFAHTEAHVRLDSKGWIEIYAEARGTRSGIALPPRNARALAAQLIDLADQQENTA